MTPDQALLRLGELVASENLDHVAALPNFAYDEIAALIAIHEGGCTTVAELCSALDKLSRPIPHAQGLDLFLEVARVNHELFSVHGFTGDTDTYDDPNNSRLDVVLDRRRGLPILLSLILIEVARRTSLHLVGVGFPGTSWSRRSPRRSRSSSTPSTGDRPSAPTSFGLASRPSTPRSRSPPSAGQLGRRW